MHRYIILLFSILICYFSFGNCYPNMNNGIDKLLVGRQIGGMVNQSIVLKFIRGCQFCDQGVAEYGCSNVPESFNNGYFTFPNKVPAGNIVTEVNVRVVGEWGCTAERLLSPSAYPCCNIINWNITLYTFTSQGGSLKKYVNVCIHIKNL